jgi:pentapeptide MXKDX repeat protein
MALLYLIVLLVNQNLKLKTMKKLFAALLLSAFTFGTFVAVASPSMQQDTTKKHKMKRDTVKKDTTKKPAGK